MAFNVFAEESNQIKVYSASKREHYSNYAVKELAVA